MHIFGFSNHQSLRSYHNRKIKNADIGQYFLEVTNLAHAGYRTEVNSISTMSITGIDNTTMFI
jgi:hypothetical protein